MKRTFFNINIHVRIYIILLINTFCIYSKTLANKNLDQLIDVSLKQEIVGSCKQVSGNEIVFKIKVFRQDNIQQQLNNIIVKDSLGFGLNFISALTSSGVYDKNTGLWSNIQLMAGDTAILIIKAKIDSNYEGGMLDNHAWVKSIDVGFIDSDSSPGNKNNLEDDYATSSVSVPIGICISRNEKVELSAPKGFATYQWFRNSIPINNATNDIFIADAIGEYSIVVSNNLTTCTSQSCCPIFVTEKCYCPPTICLPILVSLTKSRN